MTRNTGLPGRSCQGQAEVLQGAGGMNCRAKKKAPLRKGLLFCLERGGTSLGHPQSTERDLVLDWSQVRGYLEDD